MSLSDLFRFGNKDIDLDLQTAPVDLSEEMVRRDNYFHSCWMKLKALRPDLREEMDVIEIDIAGYTVSPNGSSENTEKSDSDTDDKDGHVL